ncbi:HAD-IA family hydrolase [Sphingomonas desiccabilis]|uniref:phosphoglycolate phosphatase n=1 Tax=Sphingomonas desiccabilis TaxID=429134 RepID=A0A4Q2IUJ8_9SPHN|nr:HAD-IA family hydrolase [Sphingomonas desiccabilis]MBB3911091.1 phosphoglycolate phosphatase [Sphingomonas desiccabilis]RXZ32295.1 HAD family hydrolase [Sphingomonas desiccabilis]
MMDFAFDIVGFDLDGTLVDTSGDLANALNHALADAGRPPLAREAVRTMIGGGARHMLMQGMASTGGCSEMELDRLYRLLLDHYESHIAVESAPFAGAMDAIDALESRGVKLAVVTNKLEALAEQLLGELGIRDRFACLIGGDTMGKGFGKPHRAPIDEMIRRCGGGRAAFVGDSIYDTGAARNAGIPSVACSFGFLMQPVEELEADAVIDGYDELLPVLERLGRVAR